MFILQNTIRTKHNYYGTMLPLGMMHIVPLYYAQGKLACIYDNSDSARLANKPLQACRGHVRSPMFPSTATLLTASAAEAADVSRLTAGSMAPVDSTWTRDALYQQLTRHAPANFTYEVVSLGQSAFRCVSYIPLSDSGVFF